MQEVASEPSQILLSYMQLINEGIYTAPSSTRCMSLGLCCNEIGIAPCNCPRQGVVPCWTLLLGVSMVILIISLYGLRMPPVPGQNGCEQTRQPTQS